MSLNSSFVLCVVLPSSLYLLLDFCILDCYQPFGACRKLLLSFIHTVYSQFDLKLCIILHYIISVSLGRCNPRLTQENLEPFRTFPIFLSTPKIKAEEISHSAANSDANLTSPIFSCSTYRSSLLVQSTSCGIPAPPATLTMITHAS